MDRFEFYKEKVRRFYRKHRRMPSYGELMKLVGFRSKDPVRKLVKKLVEAGMIAIDAAGKLIPRHVWGPVRVLGHVQAGWPSPAEEELLDTVTLDEHLIRNPEATYMLIARGDSMTGAGIFEGDEVLVDRSLQPKNGDTVVADVDGEFTIKHYRRIGSRLLLMPANPKYKNIEPQGDQEVHLVGVVVTVMRKLRS